MASFGTMQTTWGAAMVVPRDFLAYAIDRGELLAYAATAVIKLINKRTDAGLDVNGAPFVPHARRVELSREAGSIVRDERGRWVENELSRRPVNLRGIDDPDVQPGRRMRDNLRFSPKYPRPDQRIIWVMPQGSRARQRVAIGPRDASGRPPYVLESVRHADVARWNQNGHPGGGINSKGRPYSFQVPARPWIGLSQADRAELNRELLAPPPTAWLDTRRKERVAFNLKRARSSMKRMRRELAKGDAVAAARAEAKHKVYVQELERIGGKFTERPATKRGRKPRSAG